MKNLIQYSYAISNNFFIYLKGTISKDELIKRLREFEAHHKNAVKTEGSLCFKFSEDDTLVTTIDDLDRDLSDAKNKEFTQERMREAISLNGELLIYCQ